MSCPCGRPVVARHLCQLHYQRARRGGIIHTGKSAYNRPGTCTIRPCDLGELLGLLVQALCDDAPTLKNRMRPGNVAP